MASSDDASTSGTADTAQDPAPTPPLALADYAIGDVIGVGGMGEVVAAIDRRIEREVALKRMRGTLAPEAMARFLREAKIQARLDHPAIVPVHALGEDADGRPYFTMKRLAGVTLTTRLADGGPVQPLLRALADVCFAIQLAHARNVVHRDLKPSNIMLGDYAEVYVLDWGIARLLSRATTAPGAPTADTPLAGTEAGALLGTPGYMSPEQVQGPDVGPSSDVYSLGAILFEILAGEPLHPRTSDAAIASTLTTPTASPRERRPDRAVPPELDALCVEALAEDPTARPTARELAERIQRYLDGDRDLERRRVLAAEYLANARAAIADGRRGDAVAAAGHAVVLDPESRDAAELVMSLIVEPPRELPPELVRELEADELEVNRERSRRSARAYLGIWSWLLILPFVEIRSWPGVIALFAIANAMALISFWNTRSGRMPAWVFFVGNFALVLAFSRFAGPFSIMPVFIAGVILAMAGRSAVIDRPWTMLVWAQLAMIAPIVLEHFGVLAQTWSIVDSELKARSTLTAAHGVADSISLIFGNVALISVIAILSTQIHRGRRDAQRSLRIQAWHLRHLLPR